KLGLLVIAALLLATVGGFSSLVALLVISQFRAYNRISIFIAFLAFLPLALIVNKYQKRLPRWLAQSGLAAVLVLGILDQTAPENYYIQGYSEIKDELLSDRAFVQNIERRVPAQANIFQLPFVGFPMHANPRPGDKVSENDPFKGYFHSATLNWS